MSMGRPKTVEDAVHRGLFMPRQLLCKLEAAADYACVSVSEVIREILEAGIGGYLCPPYVRERLEEFVAAAMADDAVRPLFLRLRDQKDPKLSLNSGLTVAQTSRLRKALNAYRSLKSLAAQ